jgi:hypothetical protein
MPFHPVRLIWDDNHMGNWAEYTFESEWLGFFQTVKRGGTEITLAGPDNGSLRDIFEPYDRRFINPKLLGMD